MKNIKSFIAGAASMALCVALIGTALAADGQVSFNKAGVSLLGQQQFTAGTSYTAPNGQQVPSTITYTDAAGGETNYLSLRKLSELLDTNVVWNAETNSVEVGTTASAKLSDVTITSGTGDPSASAESGEPVYGQTIGAFEEVDPDTISALKNGDMPQAMYLQDTRVQYQYYGFSYTLTANTVHGNYLVYTVTNNSKKDQYIQVGRQPALSSGIRYGFADVRVAPGETVTRAFRIAEDANPLTYTLTFGLRSDLDRDNGTDVTISLMQYE